MGRPPIVARGPIQGSRIHGDHQVVAVSAHYLHLRPRHDDLGLLLPPDWALLHKSKGGASGTCGGGGVGVVTMVAMARAFRLPDLGEGLTEAEIVKVLVREGETIQEDAPLLEVETDKAQVEIPSPMGGRVERVHVQAGQTVKVGDVLVTFADAGVASGDGGTT